MTSDFELYVRQQLAAINKRLDAIESKTDKICVPEPIIEADCTKPPDVRQISQLVQAKLSKALARKRAKTVDEMNEM